VKNQNPGSKAPSPWIKIYCNQENIRKERLAVVLINISKVTLSCEKFFLKNLVGMLPARP
jgi:hypothetical protein